MKTTTQDKPNITIYSDIISQKPHYITIEHALNRIKNGNSKKRVAEVREAIDKEKADAIKKWLPSICFSGLFNGSRKDENLVEHSGYMILDFDHLDDIQYYKNMVFKHDWVRAVFTSPSGTGIKALVRIADGSKHQQHFDALMEIFPMLDKSGRNVSRVCFESYDPELIERESVGVFTKVKETKYVKEDVKLDDYDTFSKIMVWLSNKGASFSKGERNAYIFKLASACCRMGINQSRAESFIEREILSGNSDFTKNEAMTAINSAYKSNVFADSEFRKGVVVDRSTIKEIQIDETVLENVRAKDVIYGYDCRADILKLYRNGYEKVLSTGIPEIDNHFKFKKGELSLLTGIGNYGKSTFLKYLLLIQALQGKKIAIFSPEEAPAHEFYNDFVEMYFGKGCIFGDDRPTEMQYLDVFERITKNIFFIYPEYIAPTPDYIKERFLSLIIKEKVEFCVIDPFNQMTNEYSKSGGRSDKYLETLLSDFNRFAKVNEVYFMIVAHPKALQKKVDGNYPCPDVFDIADGAMWNNKMDNILVYHLPQRQTNPLSTVCEFHAKKIRRRKVVGVIGEVLFEYSPRQRRYFFNNVDYMAKIIGEVKSDENARIKPNLNFDSDPFGTTTNLTEVPF